MRTDRAERAGHAPARGHLATKPMNGAREELIEEEQRNYEEGPKARARVLEAVAILKKGKAKSTAAQAVGWSVATLAKRMAAMGIEMPELPPKGKRIRHEKHD